MIGKMPARLIDGIVSVSYPNNQDTLHYPNHQPRDNP